MTDKGVPKKVDKFVRKPPKQRRNTDIMSFKAPRKVSTDVEPKQTIETHHQNQTQQAVLLKCLGHQK